MSLSMTNPALTGHKSTVMLLRSPFRTHAAANRKPPTVKVGGLQCPELPQAIKRLAAVLHAFRQQAARHHLQLE
jgi:hypothetical protein